MTSHDPFPLDAALLYASRGWLVFPCHTATPSGCSCGLPDCGSPAKHPRIAHGFKSASRDPATIQRWWSRWPEANIAVRTGRESGLVVIDVDPPHGGMLSMRRLVAADGPLPKGPVVRTGSGGAHLYFRHPGEPVRNSAGTRLGPGVDIRGDGGYVVVPPSRHASGALYEWRDDIRFLPEMPDSLARRIQSTRRPENTSQREPIRLDDAVSAWARSALEGEAQHVRAAGQGTRNSTLNRAAFCLGQIVGAGALEETAVERILVDSALSCGLGEREAILTVQSGLRAGIGNPRGPRAQIATSVGTERGTTNEPASAFDVADML